MVKDTFKLKQTTLQIQNILDLLTANAYEGDMILITDGEGTIQDPIGSVKFVKSIHVGPSEKYITISKDTDSYNQLSLDFTKLTTDLQIPTADTFKNDFLQKSSKVITLGETSTDDQIPSAKAVYNIAKNLMTKQEASSFIPVNAKVTAIAETSTDDELPSAKAVYSICSNLITRDEHTTALDNMISREEYAKADLASKDDVRSIVATMLNEALDGEY